MARRDNPVEMVVDIIKIIILTILGFYIIKVLLATLF